MATLQTDEPMRDNYARQNVIDTATYPNATFVSTCASKLPTSYHDGETISFQITGNLTLHGQTNKETFAVQGKLAGNSITGTASSTIFMTDFGMTPPNLSNIAIVANAVLISIDFTAQEA